MTTILSVRRLAKSFTGVRALDGVDVDVREGEILGLVGPNGSGKTTLFNCVTGFARATSGSILWGERDTTRLAPDQIARLGIVRTFQQKMIFPRGTLRENVEMAWYGRRGATRTPVFESCDDLIECLGLQDMAETNAEDIPFGSARKLGIGLALAAGPKLLLLDEPAAGLNQDESSELGKLIGTITSLGVTVWVIEHDMPLVMSTCERIVVLHAGRKIAEGRPEEVVNDRDVISVFLGERFAREHSG